MAPRWRFSSKLLLSIKPNCNPSQKMDRRLKKTRKKQPTVYVIAGPNGAGKTTFAARFLPDFVQCQEFLNADLIAAGLSPFAPETQNVRAGRLLLERIHELAGDRRTFCFETTLSGRTYVKLLGNMKADGYRVVMLFLWLPRVGLALTRVASRVKEGGHGVAEEDIRRRHRAGLFNWFRLYQPLADSWWMYDAAWLPPRVIAHMEKGNQSLLQATLYRRIQRKYQEGPHE
jgi:predicted ABC-type ATPase